MEKQTLEVDVPDGYAVDRVTRSRINGIGEQITSMSVDFTLKRVWQWPEWLTAEWIAMDKDGAWWAYLSEPKIGSEFWLINEHGRYIDQLLMAFTPPPCDDWTQSKMRNPNRK